MMVRGVCLLAVFTGQSTVAEAGAGLRGQTEKDVEAMLLAELSSSFSPNAASERVDIMEEELRPMFAVVPKEMGGTVGHTVVRYMLHRFFGLGKGILIRGIDDPRSDNATNASTQQNSQELQSWIPSYLQGFIEHLEQGRGLSLRELAVLAATLEDLHSKDSNKVLEQAFDILELSRTLPVDDEQLRTTLEANMMILSRMGDAFPAKDKRQLAIIRKGFIDTYPGWVGVQEWLNSTAAEVAPKIASETITYTEASRVAQEVARRYGNYYLDILKPELLEVESTKAGRVRLADFYKKGLHGIFRFTEKLDYLRSMGVVDETDPAEPYVIIPNYITAFSNCIAGTHIYTICCPNECEGLMGSLERELKTATATPQQILGVVRTLASPTVEAPRDLPPPLVQRLSEIAAANGGLVPLHGRLFAQWMHHGFPRECPYPVQAAAAFSQTPEEWMAATGEQKATHSGEELQAHVDSDTCTLPRGLEAREHHALPQNELPWEQTEEELHPVFTMQPAAQPQSVLRTLAQVGALGSMVVALVSSASKGSQELSKTSLDFGPKGKSLPL